MTNNLSPVAQAVIDASWGGVPAGMRHPYAVRCEQIAAAIRTAVTNEQTIAVPDFLLPANDKQEDPQRVLAITKAAAKATADAWRDHLLGIAAELDQEAAAVEAEG